MRNGCGAFTRRRTTRDYDHKTGRHRRGVARRATPGHELVGENENRKSKRFYRRFGTRARRVSDTALTATLRGSDSAQALAVASVVCTSPTWLRAARRRTQRQRSQQFDQSKLVETRSVAIQRHNSRAACAYTASRSLLQIEHRREFIDARVRPQVGLRTWRARVSRFAPSSTARHRRASTSRAGRRELLQSAGANADREARCAYPHGPEAAHGRTSETTHASTAIDHRRRQVPVHGSSSRSRARPQRRDCGWGS